MNETMKKNLKRCLAIFLAVALVVSLSYCLAKDSRLHAEEDFDYYEVELEEEEEEEEEEIEELDFEEDFDEVDAVEELIFDDEEVEEAEEAEETEEAAEDVEEAEAAEEAEEPEEAEDVEEAEEVEYAEEGEEAEETEEAEKLEAAEEPADEFDAAAVYAEYENMSEEELNEYLAGLSEEELAKLEAYAESLDEESEEFVNSDVTYTVIFKDWDGTELSNQTVAENARAVPPTEPTREGYVFDAWDTDYLCVKGDMEITAVYITAEQAEELANITVEIGFEDLSNEAMQFGDTIRLYSTVAGVNPERAVTYQWQISRSGGLVWENVEGANGETYDYVIDESNYTLDWRLHIDIE